MLPKIEEGIVVKEGNETNKTFRIDFEKKRLAEEIDSLEAIKQAVRVTLLTQRYKYPIFSHAYGTDYRGILEDGYVKAAGKLRNAVCDSLLCDRRIKSIENFEFERVGRVLKVTFTVKTEMGDFKEKAEAGM